MQARQEQSGKVAPDAHVPKLSAQHSPTMAPPSPSRVTEKATIFPRSYLRTLMIRYHTLDAISHMSPDVINSCLDLIHAEPPTRPMAESLARIYRHSPRHWLRLRQMIRNFYTDVLHAILDVLSDAVGCTDAILNPTPDEPGLTASEQQIIRKPFHDCIRARRLVLVMLQREIRAFVDRLAFPLFRGAVDSLRAEGSLFMTKSHKLELIHRESLRQIPASYIATMCTTYRLEIRGGLDNLWL